jgi:hypothetical protein
MRDLTAQETKVFQNGGCPFCHTSHPTLTKGPTGGMSKNMACLHCEARYNVMWNFGGGVLMVEMTKEGDPTKVKIIQPKSTIGHWARALRIAWKGTKR